MYTKKRLSPSSLTPEDYALVEDLYGPGQGLLNIQEQQTFQTSVLKRLEWQRRLDQREREQNERIQQKYSVVQKEANAKAMSALRRAERHARIAENIKRKEIEKEISLCTSSQTK